MLFFYVVIFWARHKHPKLDTNELADIYLYREQTPELQSPLTMYVESAGLPVRHVEGSNDMTDDTKSGEDMSQSAGKATGSSG